MRKYKNLQDASYGHNFVRLKPITKVRGCMLIFQNNCLLLRLLSDSRHFVKCLPISKEDHYKKYICLTAPKND